LNSYGNSEKRVEYSSISDPIISLLKALYNYDGVEAGESREKHYSYDPSKMKIVPYSRDLSLGIHLQGKIEKLDNELTTNINNVEFTARGKIVFKVELNTKSEVVEEQFEIPVYMHIVTGWKDEKQAWAIAYANIRKYKLDQVQNFKVFPHFYYGYKGRLKHSKMLLIALSLADLQRIEQWFNEQKVKLLVSTAVTPATASTSASEEVRVEMLERELQELREPEVIEIKPAEPTAVTAQQVQPQRAHYCTDKEYEKLKREVEELREIVENKFDEWARRQGLVKLKLVVFRLPTEYLGSKTQYSKTEDGKIIESKVLSVNPTVARSLRTKFYDILHETAFKIYDMWALKHDADIKKLDEIMYTINETFRDILAGERAVTLVDTYFPRDYVINALTKHIEERKATMSEVYEKLNRVEKAREKSRLLRELEELKAEIEALESELKYLQSF
jgi:cell division protein FtsB